MNHLKWMGHSATILDMQQNLRTDEKSCDVILVGKEKSVRAHRFVLSSSSDLMKDLLDGTPVGQEATIIMPDIKGVLLECVLNFIYLGETSLSSTTLSDFLETISVLGIKSAISFECGNTSTGGGRKNQNTEMEDDLTEEAESEQGILNKTSGGRKNQITEITEMEDDLTEAESEQGILDKMENDQEQAIEPGTERELEFLEVYQEPEKITYSFEHNYDNSNGNTFILAENSGTITIAEHSKTSAAVVAEQSVTLSNCDISNIKEKDESECYDADEENENTQLTEEQIMDQFDSSVESATALAEPSDDSAAVYNKSESGGEGGEEFNKSDYKYSDFQAQRNESLELAAIAVVDEGMSLQKAAQKYSISKTVLWRRVKKHPLYMKVKSENPIIATACERLKTGDSLKSISQALDIPMSTLHRHKVRLAQEGRLPHYVTFKKRGPLSKELLKEKLGKALKACIDNGMSQNYAANLFEVPKSTLWRHLQKRLAAGEIIADVKEEVILS